jgi:FkbM family methyltransferase
MKQILRHTIRSTLALFDYDLRKFPRHHANSWLDQKRVFKDKKVTTIFDVGANIGQSVQPYKDLFSESHIYCFEPSEGAFTGLSNAFSEDSTVSLFPLAVSHMSGESSYFHIDGDSKNVLNSLLPFSEKSGEYYKTAQSQKASNSVKTVKLDDFCDERDLKHINILKMDIQGAELMALKGSQNLLSNQTIDLICLEVQFSERYYKDQVLFQEISTFLDQYGYLLYGLYDFHFKENGLLVWGDAIFISSKLESTLDPL